MERVIALLPPGWSIAVVVALLVTIAGVGWIARGDHWWRENLQDRFIFGVPWGSVIVLAIVLGVYLFVQDGITRFGQPVFLPYVNWSYLYPTGVFLSPLAHAGSGHLIGNLTGALVLAPIAEYIWGHYAAEPTDRLWDHPGMRAVVFFPVGVFVVALLTAQFAWGPGIGFSGAVFAFAGFAIIRFPILTVLALIARSAMTLVGRAVLDPVEVVHVTPTMSPPGWAGVSFSAHGIGFLIGAFLGLLLLHRRRQRTDPLRLWVGTLLVMTGMSLWAIWTSTGEDTYVLYRGLGIALVLLVSLVITVTAIASNRSIWGPITRRRTVFMVLLLPILVIAMVAVPFNLLTVVDHDPPDRTLSVDGYDLYYATDEERQLRPIVDLPDTGSTTSGLIVAAEDRELWTRAVSSASLERDGDETVSVGTLGSRADVTANRTGWEPLGNASVYRITLEHDETSMFAYGSAAQQSDQRLQGHHFELAVDEEVGFTVGVTDPTGETVHRPIPGQNASVEVGDVTIERVNDQLVAELEDSRIQIAEREDYGDE